MILRLILGDQLNEKHDWFSSNNENILYVMMEIRQETDYVVHHIQKVVGIFAAMRAFCETLKKLQKKVLYIPIGDGGNTQSLTQNLDKIIQTEGITLFEYIVPDEYRLRMILEQYTQSLAMPYAKYDAQHFLMNESDFSHYFNEQKWTILEYFYREIRRKYDILLNDDKTPWHGKWNLDHENRKTISKNSTIHIPLYAHNNDVTLVYTDVLEAGITTLGDIDPVSFNWPISRAQALAQLDFFVRHLLIHFGSYQDFISDDNPYLFHSRLSFALNTKMIGPLEVVHKAVEVYLCQSDAISYNQLEGFVRQIIGWREYIRAVYWVLMPGLKDMNYFLHQAPLPSWFWTGNTRMTCMHKAITASLKNAYAHHIQRLMITGNFGLLAGISPDEIDKWYLGIYIDAFEWVEMPNTRGMSQYADGGKIATKPYVSSASYINKMSDHCGKCYYDPKVKYGPRACPFNALYWHFLENHKHKLQANHRMSMMYVQWQKMDNTVKIKILEQADIYLKEIEFL